jgi:hypothetical protein
VFLAEPPRTPWDLNFQVLGFPVRVHPLFWAVALLFGLSGNQKPVDMLLWVGTVFVSILVHEMGHAPARPTAGRLRSLQLRRVGVISPTFQHPSQIQCARSGAGFFSRG